MIRMDRDILDDDCFVGVAWEREEMLALMERLERTYETS